MIDTTTLIACMLVVLGLFLIPGPAMLLVLARAASGGRWQGKIVGTIYAGLGVRLALQDR